MSAGANSLDDVRGKTREMLASDRLEKFLVSHPYDKDYEIPAKLCASIVKEVEEWLERYRKKDAEWFNDEFQYSKAMRELSEVERLAAGKMDYYLETGDVNVKDERMEQVARYAEADMVRRLDAMAERSKAEGGSEGDAEAESEARRELALNLCRRRGAVIKSVDETNDLGEPPLVASGARGDVENLDLLLMAGCKLDSATEDGGATALHMACMMGHLEYARRLVADEPGADLLLLRKDDRGNTGLFHAAKRGHLRVVKLMLERGGQELGMVVAGGGVVLCSYCSAERPLGCAAVAARGLREGSADAGDGDRAFLCFDCSAERTLGCAAVAARGLREGAREWGEGVREV